MKLEDIYNYFQNPPPIFIGPEPAVCYLFSILLQRDTYATELISHLETAYPNLQLSDTVLYTVIRFLERERAITDYWQRVEGRGRPRRMYKLVPQWQTRATELAELWQNYVNKSVLSN
ncbi:MAG: helix-turn-helix transcriptional regulator [Chroococcidiopsidaceae cyanobacterium CP_BM_ER_R8_30]|nr:helix-turn-helix transcriptional regulator [Chroococcidiopsidaceae cyanobacterium CP_BM_ER_R8_30]